MKWPHLEFTIPLMNRIFDEALRSFLDQRVPDMQIAPCYFQLSIL